MHVKNEKGIYGGLTLHQIWDMIRDLKTGRFAENPAFEIAALYKHVCKSKLSNDEGKFDCPFNDSLGAVFLPLKINQGDKFKPFQKKVSSYISETLLEAILNNDTKCFEDFKKALEFFKKEEYIDENGIWKFNHPSEHEGIKESILEYVLFSPDSPKPKFTIREIHAHVCTEFGEVSRRTIKRICNEIGLKIDSSPGAPVKYN